MFLANLSKESALPSSSFNTHYTPHATFLTRKLIPIDVKKLCSKMEGNPQKTE